MNSYVITVKDRKFYAIDDYFSHRVYWYAEVPKEHLENPWWIGQELKNLHFMDYKKFEKLKKR